MHDMSQSMIASKFELSPCAPDGVRLAKEWDPASLYARRDRRWYLKARN